MEDLIERLNEFSYNLRRKNNNLIAIDSANGYGVSKKEKLQAAAEGIPEEFIKNYSDFYGFKLLWEAKPETGIEASGSIKIQKLLDIFSDWRGITYFDFTSEDSKVRDLKIVDFYSEENAVGIFVGKFIDFTFYNAELDGSMPPHLAQECSKALCEGFLCHYCKNYSIHFISTHPFFPQ